MTHTVFVYGSLLSGLGNHGLLQRHDARALGNGRTADAFTMISLGAFPGVIEKGDTAIEGELYEVDDDGVAGLDMLEGNGSFYTREQKLIRTDGGTVVAWIYLLPPRYLEEREDVVASGNWRDAQPVARNWHDTVEVGSDDDAEDEDDDAYECACGSLVIPGDANYDEGFCDDCAQAFGMGAVSR
jgi:gamma-glutamylcyclotransferase (GGCT)/AIG2-like uncharacterized protein YtfP